MTPSAGRPWVVCAAILGLSAVGWAQEKPWAFSVRLGETYNDNRDGTTSEKESQFETRLNPRVDYRQAFDRWDIDVFYAPSLCLRSNPREFDQKKTDVYHDFGLNVDHRVSERMRMRLEETFRRSDTPSDMVGARTFREFVTYWQNQAALGASYDLLPERSVASARVEHLVKRYREEGFASIADEDDLGFGLAGKYLMKSGWNLGAEASYRTADLGKSDADLARDAKTLFAGLSVERIFGLWRARARAGFDRAEYDIESRPQGVKINDTASTIGGDVDVAYAPTDRTRVSLGFGYHPLRSDIVPYAIQKRASAVLGVQHDVGARLGFGLQASYARGTYDALDTPVPGYGAAAGGVDSVMGLGASATYTIDRNLAVEAAYRFEDWNSDETIRNDYKRNSVDVAVRAQF